MLDLLNLARMEREYLGYIKDDTRTLLAIMGIDGVQLETFLHYNGVA